MKDKEKQIEEMKCNARIHIGAVVEKLRMDGCELWEIDGIVENILNYITIPEDSVVLSREERQARDYECYNLGYEVGKKEGSKETAEKIYTFTNSFGCHNIKRFKEFLKQFGVEWNNV